jgi:hypothetical protein
MKSCRNCAHSHHEGSHRVDLVCCVFSKVVSPHPSMSIEDNLKADINCRTYASNCTAYTPEGESK